MPGVDYSRFERLVAKDEHEEERLQAQRTQADEDRVKRDLEARRQKELAALRRAEEEWQRTAAGRSVSDASLPKTVRSKEVLSTDTETGGDPNEDAIIKAAKNAARSKLAGADFSKMSKEEVENIEVDDFFRPLTEEERAERARLKEEKEERRRLLEEATGKRPLRDKGMTSEELAERTGQIQADRLEMTMLMDRCDRPAVKARLSEFIVEMDNDLARLQEDPLELDDEDRQALRLFHLRKLQLPGAARTRREFAEETKYLPKAVQPNDGTSVPRITSEEPWQEISEFALDLGEVETPVVTIDVRIEAVERLPSDAVRCQFCADSLDLQVVHGLEGRRYRLLKTCLQRDIVPERSSFQIKRNHVIVSLAKQESNSGNGKYLPWTDLCAVDRQSRNRSPLTSELPLERHLG